MNKTLQGVVMDASGSALVQTAQTFRVPQGEDWLITVPVKKQDGTAFDLTGFIGELEVKRTRLSSTPVFPKRYSDTIVSPTLGVMTFTGTRGDTLLAVPADCPFDVYVREIATNKAYRCIPETDTTGAHSIFTIEKAIVDLSAPGTPPAGGVALIGVPLPLVAGFLHTDGTSMDWAAGSGGGGTPIADPDGTNTGQAVVLTGVLPATLGWGFPKVPSYTTGARPAAASLPMGMIWNTTLECLQFSNGTTWFSVVMEAP